MYHGDRTLSEAPKGGILQSSQWPRFLAYCILALSLLLNFKKTSSAWVAATDFSPKGLTRGANSMGCLHQRRVTIQCSDTIESRPLTVQ
ncbi:hypothetical protein K458DRAFT_411439 [Lentithecium fluviatile CBS 122367]|uniref:Uncharacterized protein n=1 Tax=Lentithecium fluviatile CBS 122367 TaxID=1168545 RepID=A0A6G1JNB8_9PLEO|nr:hypothetical protein K458DRAFT_411439 [Lentithecium fluviatile CBS 122367]